MERPRRETQLPSRYREPSPLRFSVNRNDVDQALAVIAAAPEECVDKLPTFIPTELPQFTANYVVNRPGFSQYTNRSEAGFFKLLFSDSVVEIVSKETNANADSRCGRPPLSLQTTRRWVPTTIAEIRMYIGINLHFGLYPLTVRDDYWRIHEIGEFMGLKRFEQIHRFFSLNSSPTTPSNAPWFYRVQAFVQPVKMPIVPPPIWQLTKQWWPLKADQEISSRSRGSQLILATSYGVLATMVISGHGYFTQESMALRRLQKANKHAGHK
jgi:hypothetical protein